MIATIVLLAAAVPQQRVAAVLELHNKLDAADRNLVDASFLTDVVRQQVLENAPQLKLMTRENVISLLEASGKKLEECEGECEVDTGRRLGADIIVTGELLRFGKGYRLNLRLHDTHSAQLLSAAVASGDTPEALEKDLNRAVARLVQPLSGTLPVVKSPEWFDTVGFYITGALNSFGDGTNGTPRALQGSATSFVITDSHPDSAELGLGVRYAPARWLSIDAAYEFKSVSGGAEYSVTPSGGGGPQFFSTSSIPVTVNYVLRLARSFRAFGGVGAEYFYGRIGDPSEHGSGVSLTVASTRIDNKLDMVRPLLRAGIEWRPQERFGINLYGVLYPVPQDVKIYIYDTQSTAETVQPVFSYDMPLVSAHGALVLYF